jgi:putative transcriptional regulator
MLKFKLGDLLREKAYRERRRVSWTEVADAIGISRQALATLASGRRGLVTNTAHIEALCRYFRCRLDELLELEPPPDADSPCHVDELYPGRRRPSTGE